MPHVRRVHWDEAQRLFTRALAGGATRHSFGMVEWDISQNCEDPYRRVTLGRPSRTQVRKYVTVGPGSKTTLEVIMWLPCSRCGRCRKRLASSWRQRIKHELALDSRTWFGTLTFRPAARYALHAAASAAYGEGFEGLPEHHRFRLIEREGYKEVQRYWKRVREQSNVKVRYVMVAEQHADGSLHYHAILHERGKVLRYAIIDEQWHAGFSKWKLVDRSGDYLRTAHYVTKYLTKHNAGRTRASQHYAQFSLKESVLVKDAEEEKQSLGEPDLSQGPKRWGLRGGGNFLPVGGPGSPRDGPEITVLTGVNTDGQSLPSRDGPADYRRPAIASGATGAGLATGGHGPPYGQAQHRRNRVLARTEPGE